jgi:hypothetical protein
MGIAGTFRFTQRETPDLGRRLVGRLINNPVFFVNTVEHYTFVQGLFANVGTVPPPNESPEEKRAKMYRFLHDFVTVREALAPLLVEALKAEFCRLLTSH